MRESGGGGGVRLKREECSRTKHDSVCSNWQILIGPLDWGNHTQGKEGVSRYRIHNLPKSSEPGVYELGITVSRSSLGRDVRKLDPSRIVVVYLGQAANIRSRLQSYGQSGSHLSQKNRISKSAGLCDDTIPPNGSGLFDEIFSRGYPIVFRWAPMGSKKEAGETEERLLEKFDYAWNKELNNARRPDDIYKKLDKLAASSFWLPKITRILQGKVGIRIKASKPHFIEIDNQPNKGGNNNLFSRILKFSKSRPQYNRGKSDGDSSCKLNAYFKTELVDVENTPSKDDFQICGIFLEDGSKCRKAPVPSRKRCHDHKGTRIHSVQSAPRDKNFNIDLGTDAKNDQRHSNGITCGVELDNGMKCSRQPVAGRKRCQEHKGMRVGSSVAIPSV